MRAEDRGGAISLVRCPYIDADTKLVAVDQLAFGRPCKVSGSTAENWVCLSSGETYSSRYTGGHALQHWIDTRDAELKTLTVGDAAAGTGGGLYMGLRL